MIYLIFLLFYSVFLTTKMGLQHFSFTHFLGHSAWSGGGPICFWGARRSALRTFTSLGEIMKTGLGLSISLAIVFALFWGTPSHAAPDNSKELCEQKVKNYVLSDRIYDLDAQVRRDITSDERATLRKVHLSQCMLSAQELSTYWDNKSAEERADFFSNYERIDRIVTQDIYDSVFPNRQSVYTRESFLKSAVAFPMLCGEDDETDETCKREFATMFAHWLQETSGLQYLSECNSQTGCTDYIDTTAYFYNPEGQLSNPSSQ